MISNIEELNLVFDAEVWLNENFGCEFIHGGGGWANTSCPFDDHEDSNPSFGVNLEKGIYKCFGCGRTGNFINLVGHLLNVNFYQSIKLMSSFAGLDIEHNDSLIVKNEKFKKALVELNNTEFQREKIVNQATIKIKKVMKKDFIKADELYKKMDEYIAAENYDAIKEMQF